VPAGVASDAPLLIVADVLDGLRALARAARARTRARVIGVTGSVGKTSTKEMLRVMLAGQGAIHAAEKSYNNHWGVPLTLARMPRETDWAVIEIGMNAPGEIAPLARLSQLDAAIVTTVAPAHLAAFDSLVGIAREKASILDGLRPGGVAVLPADISTSEILMEQAAVAGARCTAFGRTEGLPARLLDTRVQDGVTVAQVRLRLNGAPASDYLLRLQTPGAHFAPNALAALAAVTLLGADPALAAMALGQWVPYAGRGARETIRLDPVDDHLAFDLVDDSYNANPASLGAALDMLAALVPQDGIGRVSRGRRIAVLGDMLELGPTEIALHEAVAAYAAMAAIDRVHCVGRRARALWEALPEARRGLWEETSDAMARRARSLVDAGDIVLVKGSLGIRLATVVDALKKLGQAAPDTD
jgi:UDP-N-acetylmuramoyl-tripeptide--D-alanyl-D-alanine ligase